MRSGHKGIVALLSAFNDAQWPQTRHFLCQATVVYHFDDFREDPRPRTITGPEGNTLSPARRARIRVRLPVLAGKGLSHLAITAIGSFASRLSVCSGVAPRAVVGTISPRRVILGRCGLSIWPCNSRISRIVAWAASCRCARSRRLTIDSLYRLVARIGAVTPCRVVPMSRCSDTMPTGHLQK
jgi:hypothetical protein